MVGVRVGVVVCLAVLLAACVTREGTDPGANRAVVDVAGTSEVLAAVREGVRVAFAVESSTLGERGERIAPYVTDAGAGAVDDMLASDLADARNIPLTVTVTVSEAAVSELVGDRASVAVFGMKVREDPTRFAQEWAMLVGAVRVDGSWRIDSVDDELTVADRGAVDDPLERERDSAIDAARRIAAELIGFDAGDPEGSIDRRVAVSVPPLADRLREIPSDELELWGTKRVEPDTSFGAATAVERGEATVLLAMAVENVDTAGVSTPYRHLCWISLGRDGNGDWKARDFRDVNPLGFQ